MKIRCVHVMHLRPGTDELHGGLNQTAGGIGTDTWRTGGCCCRWKTDWWQQSSGKSHSKQAHDSCSL
jgi:hypothetical protein